MAAEKGLRGVLYGVHPVEEALRSGSRSVGVLYLAEGVRGGRLREIEELARARGLKVRRVDARTLDRMVGGAVHQGVVVEADARPSLDLDEVLADLAEQEEAVVVVLDGVQDPHNLGAVVRNAALAGAAAVLIPKDRSAGVTPVVEKVAAGGLEHVKVVRAGNVAQALRRLKEERFWIYGAAGEAGLRGPVPGGFRRPRRPRPGRGARGAAPPDAGAVRPARADPLHGGHRLVQPRNRLGDHPLADLLRAATLGLDIFASATRVAIISLL